MVEEGEVSDEWSCRPTVEEEVLHFRKSQKKDLIVVGGRQIESQERLEVLAVGSREDFKSGTKVHRLIREIENAGGVPVLPWGFGKWFGTRGRSLERVIKSPDLPEFFLGDSAHRPSLWPESACFRRAEEYGIQSLPGSDPLPIQREVGRVGEFGFMMKGELDLNNPAQDLRRKLLNASTPLYPFGDRVDFLRSVQNQVLMQYRKLVQ